MLPALALGVERREVDDGTQVAFEFLALGE